MCDEQSTVNLASGQWPINSHEGLSIASWKQQCERVPLVIFSTFLSSSTIYIICHICYCLSSIYSISSLQSCLSVQLMCCLAYLSVRLSVCPSIRSSFNPSIFREKQASGSGRLVSSTRKCPVCASDWATTAFMFFRNHSLSGVLLDAV